MHALEVIIARNERAAAREEAHARSDGNRELATRIEFAQGYPDGDFTENYMAAYDAAIQEG